MSRKQMSPRPYDNTTRTEQARALRHRVIDAARELIVQRGPVAVSIRDIADRAAVSRETVQKAFGSKSALIKTVYDATVAGDDEPTALADRPQITQIIGTPDPREKLSLYAALARHLGERLAPLLSKLRAGANSGDPDLRELVDKLDAERLTGVGQLVQHLADTGCLRAGVETAHARDLVWALISPEMYDLLVTNRRWSPDTYQTWLTKALTDALAPATGIGETGDAASG
ncbi:TetR/AcrR family transcriptional regulator [Phytohabitans kaempferiae]|uniref:TetR/AcrR family transcriptional regulator n=1 Tax=Phytohabitans kaempferiae TaxID=1620943 RepID=A0ABV6M5V7_9ACTN